MKIAVYTAIFGEKDSIKKPLNFNRADGVDYFLITDNKQNKSNYYKIISRQTKFTDIAKNARYYKLFGLEEFDRYDYVIWHDANLQLLHNTIPEMIKGVRDKRLATYRHPNRTNFYDEAIACILDKKEEPLKLFKQCFQYFLKNVSPYSGLYETSILVKNNSTPNHNFYKTWWKEIKKNSRRDQISLPYTIWKHQIQIGVLEGERMASPYAIYYEHNYSEYIGSKRKVGIKLVPDSMVIKFIENLKKLSRKVNPKRIES